MIIGIHVYHRIAGVSIDKTKYRFYQFKDNLRGIKLEA